MINLNSFKKTKKKFQKKTGKAKPKTQKKTRKTKPKTQKRPRITKPKTQKRTRKSKGFSKQKKTPAKKVLIAHDNRKGHHTTKAHAFAHDLEKDSHYKVLVDQKTWKRGERPSKSENIRREKNLVNKADLVVRFIPNTSKGKRNEGAQREVRKAINSGKPVIEIFENGARDSPNRPLREKNYRNRTQVNLRPGQRSSTGFKQGVKKLNKKTKKKNNKKK